MARLITPFAVIRGGVAFLVSLFSDGSVATADGVPFAFDPIHDAVTTRGNVMNALAQRGVGNVRSNAVSIKNLNLTSWKFSGVGAVDLVTNHPNIDLDDTARVDLITKIFAASGEELAAAA